ncbi:MAG: 4-hydroxybenzoate octaprenyltransferase [Burkholderiales bacterium]|nr:4-hydroxybenzoate octaprenyltransferase [Burkholderiales bacterium]
MKDRLALYERLMRLDKPIGILLLLWPTLWGVWIAAEGRPRWPILWIFVLGTVLMRSAGCVLNDMADARFDAHVRRTRDRPIAAGRVTRREAFVLAGVLIFASFLLVLPLNWLTIVLSAVALFLAATYPFTKRFLAVPQAYLGIAFGAGIPMAFAATRGEIPMEAWCLLAANVLWAIAYDTEYAMVDREDDLKIGIRTSAITFGRFDVAAVLGCYAGMLAILAALGRAIGMGGFYFAGLAAAGMIALYHYRLIRGRDPERCFKAFLHNNWLGAAVFAGIAADYWLRDAGG